MNKNKAVTFYLSISLALAVFLAASLCPYGAAAPPDAVSSGVSAEASFKGGTNYVNELFRSDLPLIILELEGMVPDTADEVEKGFAASMRVVDSGGGNRPDGESCYSADILLSAIRYENDGARPKKDYFISVTNGGESALQGLSPGSYSGDRWILLGGAYDKSLIRNYLGYTLAKRVLNDAPNARLCELLLKNDGGYEYRGVYLLVEGNGAEDTVSARRTEHYWAGFNQDVVYAGDAGVFVLQENRGGNLGIEAMGEAISVTSYMFSSGDTNYYLQYGDILDVKSFQAYFLINELMASYEGMNESVYTYSNKTGKIAVGPVWNFERALDNQQKEAMNLRQLKYQSAPFYRHMIIDSEFINGLINVSKEYAAELDSAEIGSLIDSAVTKLGQAQERDWYRWQAFYLSGENALSPYRPPESDARIGSKGIGYNEQGALLVETGAYYSLPGNAPERIRQFNTYEGEIVKLKFYACERPAFVRKAILLLKNQDDLLTRVDAYGRNSVWAIIFIAGFILSIILARVTAER